MRDTSSVEHEGDHLIRPFRGTFPSEGKARDDGGMRPTTPHQSPAGDSFPSQGKPLDEGKAWDDGGLRPHTPHQSAALTASPPEGKPLEDMVIRAPSHEEWIRMRISDLALEIKSCIKAGAPIRHEIVAEYNIKVKRRGRGEGGEPV